MLLTGITGYITKKLFPTLGVFWNKKQRFKEQVFDDYITKPIKADELNLKMKKFIRN